MTVLADPPIVISTEAKRSGEISPSDGTGGITVGDLSTQSIIGAVPVCLPYRHASPLEMTMLASPHLRHFDRSEAEWRNLTSQWYMKH